MNAIPGRLVLLGHPVAHSLSPRFQNAALRAAGLPLVYEALDVEPGELERAIDALRSDGAAGNVTTPHKHRVAAMCDTLSPVAVRTGAVNTFWLRDGALVGDNTDVDGFRALLRTVRADLRSARVALLGAGGAAAAVLACIESEGAASVAIHNRSPERARSLAARYPGVASVHDELGAAVRGASIVVNATSVGMRDDHDPVPIDELDEGAVVIDLVYRPGRTAWVRRAEARGHRAIDGMEMLLAQGALAFERWFGRRPDLRAMREAVGAC